MSPIDIELLGLKLAEQAFWSPMPNSTPTPECAGCHREPAEIPSIIGSLTNEAGERLYLDADAYVRQEEGTYNPITGHFLCDTCYIAWGMPTAPGGWKAP